MDLKTYLAAERGRAKKLAAHLKVSPSFLSQMASGKAAISASRAREIEQWTNGEVTRQELLPSKWRDIWPELARRRAPAAPTPAPPP